MPLRRLHLPQRAVDADLPELVDHERREIHVQRDRPGSHLHAQGPAGTVAGVGQELPGPRLVVRRPPVARQSFKVRGRKAPGPRGRRAERGPHDGAALMDRSHVGATVDGQAQRPSDLHVVEGRPLGVEQQIVVHADVDFGDDHSGRGRLELLDDGSRALGRHGGVELPGLQRRKPGAPLRDDDIPEAVKVRATRHEVLRIPDVLDILALAPLFQPERARADATSAELGGSDVGGVDGRIPRREHHQERRLRAPEPEGDGIGIGHVDGLDRRIPILPGINPEPGRGLRRLPNHVEGVLHIFRSQRLAVVPADVTPKGEGEGSVIARPCPSLGEIAHDGVGSLHGFERLEGNEVVEAGKAWPDRRVGRGLVDGEALRQVFAQHEPKDPAAPRSRRRTSGRRTHGVDRGDGQRKRQERGHR